MTARAAATHPQVGNPAQVQHHRTTSPARVVGWTVHRALPDTSDVLREVMTVTYVADGERVQVPGNRAQQNDLETWLPGLRPGDQVTSELDPALPRG